MNNGRLAVHRSLGFGSTQICRVGLFDIEPSDNTELFDILLTDVNNRILHEAVSKCWATTTFRSQKPYLRPQAPTEPKRLLWSFQVIIVHKRLYTCKSVIEDLKTEI